MIGCPERFILAHDIVLEVCEGLLLGAAGVPLGFALIGADCHKHPIDTFMSSYTPPGGDKKKYGLGILGFLTYV